MARNFIKQHPPCPDQQPWDVDKTPSIDTSHTQVSQLYMGLYMGLMEIEARVHSKYRLLYTHTYLLILYITMSIAAYIYTYIYIHDRPWESQPGSRKHMIIFQRKSGRLLHQLQWFEKHLYIVKILQDNSYHVTKPYSNMCLSCVYIALTWIIPATYKHICDLCLHMWMF